LLFADAGHEIIHMCAGGIKEVVLEQCGAAEGRRATDLGA
jgi:hypothetical protein